VNERNEGEEKKHTINLMVQGDDILFVKLSNPKSNHNYYNIKNFKYCYRLNPKTCTIFKELQPQLQNLTHNLENYTKIILNEIIMN
jgi:hypothetical protein